MATSIRQRPSRATLRTRLTTRPRYLIDNSVWARLPTVPEVVAALRSVVESTDPNDILICAPVAVEVAFSARNGPDHSVLLKRLTAFPECPEHPTANDAMDIQNRLWNSGLIRAAGAMDTLIAAYAEKNDATLLHYDRDFEHIGSVVPTFHHRWIVPRGSIA